MWDKLVAWWDKQPHLFQAVIVAFAGGIWGVLEPVVQNWAGGQSVCTVAAGACLKIYGISALRSGVAAVVALYVKSSFYKPKP